MWTSVGKLQYSILQKVSNFGPNQAKNTNKQINYTPTYIIYNNENNKIFITVAMYLTHRAIGDTYYYKINRKNYVQYHNR